jgi:hypothetical protein
LILPSDTEAYRASWRGRLPFPVRQCNSTRAAAGCWAASCNAATFGAVCSNRCCFEGESLNNFQHLFEIASYVGRVSQLVQQSHEPALTRSGVNGETSFIVGGQVQGEQPGIYLVYPQGNFIRASEDTPYLQIGENKYGKPMLDRLVSPTFDARPSGATFGPLAHRDHQVELFGGAAARPRHLPSGHAFSR